MKNSTIYFNKFKKGEIPEEKSALEILEQILSDRNKRNIKKLSSENGNTTKIPIKKSKEKNKENTFTSYITIRTKESKAPRPFIPSPSVGGAIALFNKQQENILKMIENNAPKKDILKELAMLSHIGGFSSESPYEGLYVATNKELRKKFIDERNNLYLDKFDPEGWKNIENHEVYKKAVNDIVKKAEENFWKYGREERVKKGIEFAKEYNVDKIKKLEYALGRSVIIGKIKTSVTENKNGKYNLRIYVRYNLSDKFQKIIGDKIPIEWGKPYDMVGPSQEKTIYEKTFNNKRDALSHLNRMRKELVR